MIIGFDGSRAFIPEKTGTENYSYQLLKTLAKVDQKNDYIVYLRPEYSSSETRSYHKNINISKESSRFSSNNNINWPNNFKFKQIMWPRLWTQGGLAFQTFKDKVDVLFIPAHTLPVIRKPGLKTVVTMHDLGSEYLPSMHQLKQRLYLSIMQRYQLKGATKIIVVSKATKTDLVKRMGIEADKVKVVYEGYDREKFKYQISDIKFQNDALFNSLKQYRLIPGSYFLFVGTVQPRKNLERVIRAFAIHLREENKVAASSHLGGGIRLVIAGSKGWLSDEIYQLPEKLGIKDKVKFLGYVPEKDLPALYSGAIALVFPSLFEGFGLPILEAQACGCPVITSKISSMPEVAGKGAILVNPYSTDEIADTMIRVQGTGYREQLVKKGFENIKRFSWEKCAGETLKILQEAAG